MKTMIILGDRYRFTKLELDRLKEEFEFIEKISCKNISAQQVIENVDRSIQKKAEILIVLNTKTQLSKKLLMYLTALELQGTVYVTIENFLKKYLRKCYINQDEITHAHLEEISGYTYRQYALKRIIDLTGVVFLFPFAVVAAAITYWKIQTESPGELFFKQKRMGRGGEEFFCVKFRSMHREAESEGAVFARENDGRAYAWGKVLRRLKGDELAQLWNVVKGDMHLVGPRPERKVWIEEFEKSIPFYMQRHIVSPGITGLAQVKYPYGTSIKDAEQKLMYDLYYIKHWTLGLELQVMWKTAQLILSNKKKNLAML